MAFRLQQFQCEECEQQTEQLLTSWTDEEKKAEKPCEHCGADPEKLVPIIGVPTHKRHLSWSKWQV